MLLFSGKLKLTFKPLAQEMQHLKLAATWAESEWGYIRNKGIPFRMNVLDGAKVICEGRLFSEPTDVLSIRL